MTGSRLRGPLAEVVTVLDGSTLRHLAACADALRRPPLADPFAAADELAAMVEAGATPTLGWWRKHLRHTPKRKAHAMTTTETKAPPRPVAKSGNLTRDPLLRFSAKGAAWTACGLAVDRRVRNDEGEWEDAPTEYFDVVCFGDLAESVAECLAVGDRVVVVGKLEHDTWTGRDGTERTTAKIVAEDLGPSLKANRVELHRNRRSGAGEEARAAEARRILEADDPFAVGSDDG